MPYLKRVFLGCLLLSLPSVVRADHRNRGKAGGGTGHTLTMPGSPVCSSQSRMTDPIDWSPDPSASPDSQSLPLLKGKKTTPPSSAHFTSDRTPHVSGCALSEDIVSSHLRNKAIPLFGERRGMAALDYFMTQVANRERVVTAAELRTYLDGIEFFWTDLIADLRANATDALGISVALESTIKTRVVTGIFNRYRDREANINRDRARRIIEDFELWEPARPK